MIHAASELSGLISAVASDLPNLPSAIRYYDDFDEKLHIIRDPEASDSWEIKFDGEWSRLDFCSLERDLKFIFKHIAVDLFSRLAPSGATTACQSIISNPEHLIQAMIMRPENFRALWFSEVRPYKTWGYALNLRTMLHTLCILSIGLWRPEMRPYVSQLESPTRDVYKTVRTGECFLPLDHQSLLIDYLDDLSCAIRKAPEHQSTIELRDACILVIAHQHGCRPGQIARIKTTDVRCYENGAVHLAIPLLKQRGSEVLRRVTRRVSSEWAPIMAEYTVRRAKINAPNGLPPDSYFNLAPQKLSIILRDLLEKITGTRWSPTDLRHTAAQRLADAGTSHIALSEFMGHSTTLTANVYFDASPNQAQRINQALAISNIYSNVAAVARTRTIDKGALLRLPPDQQIGGAPHGIPIAGIGGCSAGQSLCSKNPVLSCYTCRKFLPLSDFAVHESVVESLRPVVTEFANASRFNEESPAYTQLRRMFQAALQVAEEVRAMHMDSGAQPT
ncbi:site-specific integrase [Ectopseudomonas toyotomiensis]|uniref:site-specific integrase n=1 Tax=Ectopseudomonas toyotomiensis TaxID=554344 RepID=UPI003D0E8E55